MGTTEVYYYHTDQLGSSSVITNAAGAKVQDLAYYPYGQTRINTGAINVNHKYTSQELDESTGLYFYNARYYDPVMGRFISADTIVPHSADPEAFNRYSYVRNNPLKYTDPTGHGWFKKAKKRAKKAIKNTADQVRGAVDKAADVARDLHNPSEVADKLRNVRDVAMETGFNIAVGNYDALTPIEKITGRQFTWTEKGSFGQQLLKNTLVRGGAGFTKVAVLGRNITYDPETQRALAVARQDFPDADFDGVTVREGGLWPTLEGSDGVTLPGGTVIIDENEVTPNLVFHELVHIKQIQEDGDGSFYFNWWQDHFVGEGGTDSGRSEREADDAARGSGLPNRR